MVTQDWLDDDPQKPILELERPDGKLVDIEIGSGDPTKPWQKELSEEDEKRLDHEGRPVAMGQLWSQAHTGFYLTVLGARAGNETHDAQRGAFGADRRVSGRALKLDGIHGDVFLFIGVSFGLPKFNVETIGGALEIPADLDIDPAKKEYVTSWLVDHVRTVGLRLGVRVEKDKLDGLAVWCVNTADDAIRAVWL